MSSIKLQSDYLSWASTEERKTNVQGSFYPLSIELTFYLFIKALNSRPSFQVMNILPRALPERERNSFSTSWCRVIFGIWSLNSVIDLEAHKYPLNNSAVCNTYRWGTP